MASRAFVDPDRQGDGVLASKAAGQSHGGGAPWPPGSAGQVTLLSWTAAGTPVGGPDASEPPATAAPTTAPAPTPAATLHGPPPGNVPPGKPRPAPHPGHPAARPRGLALFGGTLVLNGRFDLNLERRAFETNPWAEASTTAIQSFHHFLFLSRQSAEDPFTFTAEITSLAFFEVGARFVPPSRTWRLHVRFGKLLVPFGNEPLFHQSYGGHAGFDQRVLPIIWAAEGVAASGSLDVGTITLSSDLYGVRGHGLRRADTVLNLQNDLSPIDEVRPALGVRLGVAWSALSAFYSAYFNPLGHDRRLFMQAIDITLWRWRDLPVLDRLVLGGGLLRADVSGGGPGVDYYHFASYWLARLYLLDGLSLQYRQGLRTFDNKRNLIFDGRRRAEKTARPTTSRWRPATGGSPRPSPTTSTWRKPTRSMTTSCGCRWPMSSDDRQARLPRRLVGVGVVLALALAPRPQVGCADSSNAVSPSPPTPTSGPRRGSRSRCGAGRRFHRWPFLRPGRTPAAGRWLRPLPWPRWPGR